MPELPPKHDPFPKPPKAARDRERKRLADRKRADDPLRKQYGAKEWREGRKAFLALPGNDRCWCGCGKRANTVHHKTPPRSAMPDLARALELFWDRNNWRPAHFKCNSREAAAREGGFGNPRRP